MRFQVLAPRFNAVFDIAKSAALGFRVFVVWGLGCLDLGLLGFRV